MNTIQRTFIALVSISGLVCLAGERTGEQTTRELKIDAFKTPVIDGFCMGLEGKQSANVTSGTTYGTNNTSPDDMLIMLPWTTNGPSRIAVPAEPEYAYQVELLGTNGAAVPKTALGKQAGRKFGEFDAHPSKHGIPIKHLNVRKVDGITEAPFLFRPSDLFKIDKPGNYTLRIRFQILVFPKTGPGPRDHTNELIRFPPLEYPLVKMKSAKEK